MIESHKRNPLISWYVGLVLVIVGVGYVARQMYITNCEAPAAAIFIILGAIPLIYLALMYLTLKSQP
ncbi:MAG: hypothetical protein KDE14_10515 [Rhodobacteraceae bacterium]|nr:hypothetical protein [Paracoccaceae bacterium]